jgi:hypothetical protein
MLLRTIPEASQDRGPVRMTAGDRQSPSTAFQKRHRLFSVVPGLDPGIHQSSQMPFTKMDCRVIWLEDALRAFGRQ